MAKRKLLLLLCSEESEWFCMKAHHIYGILDSFHIDGGAYIFHMYRRIFRKEIIWTVLCILHASSYFFSCHIVVLHFTPILISHDTPEVVGKFTHFAKVFVCLLQANEMKTRELKNNCCCWKRKEKRAAITFRYNVRGRTRICLVPEQNAYTLLGCYLCCKMHAIA